MTHFWDVDRGIEHAWTIRDACEGTQIFGATGSGKTTGSGRHLAVSMLRKGFGGLVLCATGDEAGNWAEYLVEAGRDPATEAVVLRLGSGQRFDFLDYEFQQKQGGELTQNLVTLFSTAIAATGGDDRGSSTDPFWADALRQLVMNAIDLAAIANDRGRLADINRIVVTAPQKKDVRGYLRSSAYGAECLRRANDRAKGGELPADRIVDLEQTIEYWLNDFAGLAPRTRSIVVSSFTSRATGLLRSPLQSLFCPADPPEGERRPTVTPEDCRQGTVIILDLPIKEFGEVGRFAQIIFKTVWQRAIERQKEQRGDRPVLLWADESQCAAWVVDREWADGRTTIEWVYVGAVGKRLRSAGGARARGALLWRLGRFHLGLMLGIPFFAAMVGITGLGYIGFPTIVFAAFIAQMQVSQQSPHPWLTLVEDTLSEPFAACRQREKESDLLAAKDRVSHTVSELEPLRSL